MKEKSKKKKADKKGLEINEKCNRCVNKCKQFTMSGVILTSCPTGKKFKKK